MRYFARAVIFVALILGATVGGQRGGPRPTVASRQSFSETILVLTDVELARDLPLFAYCRAPQNAEVGSVTLHAPGKLDLNGSQKVVPERTSQDSWSIFTFGAAGSGGPDRVNVVCRIKSQRPAQEIYSEAFFFTLLDERPIPVGELNRNTNIRFDPRPVKDRATQSGTFIYYLPWSADVSIRISKRTNRGLEDTKIVLEAQKSGAGLASTEWGRQHQFDRMRDGDYEGRIVAKKTASGSSRPTKVMLAPALFRRGG